jgi:hypothetical protein
MIVPRSTAREVNHMEKYTKLEIKVATVFHDKFGDWKVGYWSVAKAAVLKTEWTTAELAELIHTYLPGWHDENWRVVNEIERVLSNAGFKCRQRMSSQGIEFLDEKSENDE